MSARDRLAAIAARVEAATEGPWLASHNMTEDTHDVSVLYSNGIGVVIADCRKRDTDAIFIAHARTDVPALVAFATTVLDASDGMYDEDGDTAYIERGDYVRFVAKVRALADELLGGAS